MADIEIEIDGQTCIAKPNQTVIQVADDAGIYIPRFCYHKHLSIPANCRMCLVEVEKSPKALPACATPVMPGMKVFTKSQKTIAAQRAVMEFLLINHPLDCPICDQGGECELQDLSMGYGASTSEYNECKRAVPDDNLGPLIATDMTRCILCTRCIRYGEEIAGIRELGMTYRGEHEEVTTFVKHAMQSEVSGNIIDICPVGALTSKPYRFTARAWELTQTPSISPHDCLGTNINVHTRNGKVMRVVSRENDAINQTWISDRDRFSYAGLDHPDRLTSPMIKMDGVWQAVDWQQALAKVSSDLQAVIAKHGADKLGALASPNSTLEEFYLLQKLMRGLDSPHIDHRLRETDHQDQHSLPLFPGLKLSMTELANADAVLLLGSNLQKEQPLAALRLRKAALNGASVLAVNPVDYDFHFPLNAKHIVAPQHFVQALTEILSALENSQHQNLQDENIAIAKQLSNKKAAHIILGASAMHHPQASQLRYLASRIAEVSGASINLMTDGANSAGAWLVGAIPHRHLGGETINHVGLDAYSMLHKPRKAYLLLNVEPEFDMANAVLAREALKQADCVVALSMYRDATLEAHADIILPIAAFTETAGTYVNVCGDWQSVQGVATPFGEARPAWKILRVLGNFMHLAGFDYESVDEITQEIKHSLDKAQPFTAAAYQPDSVKQTTQKTGLYRIGDIPLYAVDSLVRHSQPLQTAQTVVEGDTAAIRLHPDTAKHLQVNSGDKLRVKQQASTIELFVTVDARIAKEAAWIAGGIEATRDLGDLFGELEIEKG